TCAVSISERIQCYRQFLIEELDGQKLLAHLREKSLVSIDEEHFFLKQTSRRARLSALLDMILGKGTSELEVFRSYLEKYANSIYVLMWQTMDKETERYITSLALDLDQHYPELIDRIEASIFFKFDEDFHMPRFLVDELLRNPNRNDRAKMILQHVQCQNESTRRQFIQMLLFYNQLNRGDLQRPQRLLELVHKKMNITDIRKSKLTRDVSSTDRIHIPLGQFCLQTAKGYTGSKETHESAGDISSSSTTYTCSAESHVESTQVDGAMRDSITMYGRLKSSVSEDIDSAYGSFSFNQAF
ncbi:hypothetical protein MAR_006105, partial [Mya arenaria]